MWRLAPILLLLGVGAQELVELGAEEDEVECGVRNLGGLRVQGAVGQEVAGFGEWPHVCILLTHRLTPTWGLEGAKDFQCMASLLDKGTLLTAAHCVNQLLSTPEVMVVRCGEWDSSGNHSAENLPHQERNVTRVVVHPKFHAGGDQFPEYSNDLAVIFLAKAFQLDAHLSPVCLPDSTSDYDTTNCFVTGHGKNASGGRYQPILKTVGMSIWDNEACKQSIEGVSSNLSPSDLCAAGAGGQGSCMGDDGGALVCSSSTSPSTFLQAGVVSWWPGETCGEAAGSKTSPGVYAGVAAASCWIRGILQCGPSDTRCHGGVLRNCSKCRNNFRQDTNLTGKKIGGKRGRTRSIGQCWARCRKRPNCRFITWVRRGRRANLCTLLRTRGRARKAKGAVSGKGC